MSRHFTRWIGVALAIVVLTLPVQAQNVLTLRVESMDALIEDIDTLAVALGEEPGTGENLVKMAAGMLGMQHFDMIDGKSPLVVALPLQGMMLGEQGFVGAFPVNDVDAAIEAMKAAKDGATVDENGLLHIPMGEAGEMLLMPADGYLIYGRNPNLVGGFSPTELLSGAHLPPGTIAAEFNVDSMRAMIGMTIEGVRQGITQSIAQGGVEGTETLDPEAAAAISGTVVDWMQSLVANTRAVQLSFQVTDSHVMVHNHYLPVANSTLGDFLKAQKGGMPSIAKLLDGGDSSMTFVGNTTWTDASIAALENFAQGYATLITQTMQGQEETAAFAEMIPAMFEQYSGMWKCTRGDMAQVVDMSDGISFTQVSGIIDSEECRGMDKAVAGILDALPEEVGDFLSYSPGAFSHGGTQVARMSINMESFFTAVPEEEAEIARGMLEGMFGEDGFSAFMAAKDNLWVGTGGAGGEEAMRTMLDRIGKGKSGSGIDEATFAPFDVGPGFYMSMDFGKLFEGLKDLVPEDAGAEIAEVQEVFEALGAMTTAFELQPDALAFKFALGTEGLGKIAEMVKDKNKSETEHHDDRDHGHEHGEGGEHGHGHDHGVEEKHEG